jgi:uncharacterized protein
MIELKIHESLREIPRLEWQRLLGENAPPFLAWDFLDALERSGCVTADRGWLPFHMTLWEDEELVAAAPAYVKGHSEGEFVFDFGWADFAQRLRIRYYPKLLLAVPFTPATGPRVLVADGASRERMIFAVGEGARRILGAQSMSSSHILFPTETEAQTFHRAGYALRMGMQYQWHNQGYGTFEDFLSTMPSKKRTQIRRERKEMERQGIRIDTLSGADITEEVLDAMYAFYELTVDKFRWGRRYLNREFFADICERMPKNVEIVLARDSGGKPIGGALNLVGGGVRYGRYWGATEDRPFLHFNVCYYHSIERSIADKVVRFEPGAGGEHKRARGFSPTLTYSVHDLVDPRLNGAVRDYLQRECDHMQRVVRGEIEDEA